MTKEEAQSAALTFRRCGWDVWATESLIWPGVWRLAGTSANNDGEPYVYGLSHNDMKTLVLGGQVVQLSGKKRVR